MEIGRAINYHSVKDFIYGLKRVVNESMQELDKSGYEWRVLEVIIPFLVCDEVFILPLRKKGWRDVYNVKHVDVDIRGFVVILKTQA